MTRVPSSISESQLASLLHHNVTYVRIDKMTNVRRSGRRRQPVQRQVDGGFEDLYIEDGHVNLSEDEDFEPVSPPQDEDDDQDEDLEPEDEAEPDEDDLSDASAVQKRPPKPRPQKGQQKSAPSARGSKVARLEYFFGPGEEDQQPVLRADYKWNTDLPLPTRKANLGGFGGFSHGFYRTEAQRRVEMQQDWKWYDDYGKSAFETGQTQVAITLQEAEPFLTAGQPIQVIAGPQTGQTAFQLDHGSSLNLQQPFSQIESKRTARSGFMINVGGKVQAIDWAPNQDGSTQCLAISTTPSNTSNTETQSAFSPQPGHKASIQFWTFNCNPDHSIDMNATPKLSLVLCCDWGHARDLKWCPAPRQEASGSQRLGLLAAVWTDGAIRVLDISLPLSDTTQYIHCTAAAFTTRPPQTVCTCICWISAFEVAVGCADGCVGVWNLPNALKTQSSDSVIYGSVQSTYITKITSGYPSKRNMLFTASMSGYLSSTDLYQVTSQGLFNATNTLFNHRSRSGKTLLAWHDWTQMLLSSDDNLTIMAWPLRKFTVTIGMTRLDSVAAALAVSPVHPFVMAGSVGGACVSINSLRKSYQTKVVLWSQTWFLHEWRRANDSAMVRITEGFKPEQVRLHPQVDDSKPDGGSTVTIYEMETAVTDVCWNPNIHVGGWVAAGFGSGLLRVEDVAIA